MTSVSIKEILREGSSFDLPQLRLYYRAAGRPTPQSACIVGKKVHPHATTRHRYQRLLREATRAFLRHHPSYDMVVVAKPAILSIKKLSELQEILAPYFDRLSSNAKRKTQNAK